MQGNYISKFLIKVYEHPPYWSVVSTFLCLLAVGAFLFYLYVGALVAKEFLEVLLAKDPDGMNPDDKSAIIRNLGLVLAAFLGAPLVVWRSKIAFDQVQTAQERMITDRFSKAVDQIGAVRRVPRSQTVTKGDERVNWEEEQPNIEVRLGGLYTLQRISEDSLPDHVRVVETMCAYVRLNSLSQMVGDDGGESYPPEVDIQAALYMLGKRPEERIVYEMNLEVPLDFSDSVLRKSNLNALRLPFVDFDNSDLRYARLQHTDLRQASLEGAKFQSADFHECLLYGAILRGADLSDTNITPKMLDSAYGVKFGCGETKLPDGMAPPIHWFEAEDTEKDSEELRSAFFQAYEEHFSGDPHFWRPGKKLITINDVRINR
ncbi:MAG: pentapeptide repeat-containing protein [Marinobacter sp.]|nr:pentapeptide repeat-containing protein [Marinobacter sp.]